MKSATLAPLVSVIIVSWNAKKYLVDCLESLAGDACRCPLEIIVVDNASTDGSPDVVERDYPHVKLIRNGANLGFAAANNLGIAASRGPYLALVNSDVKVLPHCITRLVDYCEAHDGVGVVGPRVIGRDGKLQRSCRGFPTLWNMFCRAVALDTAFPRARAFTGYSLTHWPQEETRPVEILSGCFWLIRRAALNDVGLLDEGFFMYGEDMDWCKRFWSHGWELVFVPAAEAIHYGGASSANAPVRFYVEMERANLQYWAKHHSRAVTFGYFLISCLHLSLRAVGYWAVSLGRRAEGGVWRHKVERSVACLKWMVGQAVKQPQAIFGRSGLGATSGPGRGGGGGRALLFESGPGKREAVSQ